MSTSNVDSWCYRLVVTYYSAGLVCLLAFILFSKDFRRTSLVVHGKAIPSKESLSWQVSKNHFTWFYAIGLIAGIVLFDLDAPQEWLLLLHLTRRFGETLIWPYSKNSTMHLIHAVVGTSFYPVLVLSFYFSSSNYQTSLAAYILALSLMIWQHYIHRLLYGAKMSYKRHAALGDIFPEFKHILCPHYLAEVLIYLAFTHLCNWSLLMILNLLFVLVNLWISAESSLAWYHLVFPRAINRPASLFPNLFKAH